MAVREILTMGDARLLRIAASYEDATDWTRRMPAVTQS